MPRVTVYQGGAIQREGVTGARHVAADFSASPVGQSLQRLGEAVSNFGERRDQIEAVHDEQDRDRLDLEHLEQARIFSDRIREARGSGAQAVANQLQEEWTAFNDTLLGRARSSRARQALEGIITRRTIGEVDRYQAHADQEFVQERRGTLRAGITTSTERARDIDGESEAARAFTEEVLPRIRQWAEFEGLEGGMENPQAQAVLLEQSTNYYVGRARSLHRQQGATAALEYLRSHEDSISADALQTFETAVFDETLEEDARQGAGPFIVWADGTVQATGPGTGQTVPGNATPAPAARPGRVRATGTAGQLAAGLQGLPAPVIAGFLGNAQHESAFDSSRVGDRGTAFGHMQWRAERVANFQRVIGVHPRGATAAQSARFIRWEMDHPEQAGMGRTPELARANRDRILRARTPEEAARLIDQFYERSDGRARSARAVSARRFYEGGDADTGGDPGDPNAVNMGGGEQLFDLPASLARVEAAAAAGELTPHQRRAYRAEITRRYQEQGQARQIRESEAGRRYADWYAQNGDTFTSMTDVPQEILVNMSPEARASASSRAGENRRRALAPQPEQPVDPQLLLEYNATRYGNPSRFASPEFRDHLISRGAPQSLMRSWGSDAGTIVGQGVNAQRNPERVTDDRLWSIANPILQEMGLNYTEAQGRSSTQRQADRVNDARLRNRVLEHMRMLSTEWLRANPGRQPDDALMRGWITQSVRQSAMVNGQQRFMFELSGNPADVARVLNPADRAAAERSLRAANLPVTPEAIGRAHLARMALTARRRQ